MLSLQELLDYKLRLDEMRNVIGIVLLGYSEKVGKRLASSWDSHAWRNEPDLYASNEEEGQILVEMYREEIMELLEFYDRMTRELKISGNPLKVRVGNKFRSTYFPGSRWYEKIKFLDDLLES